MLKGILYYVSRRISRLRQASHSNHHHERLGKYPGSILREWGALYVLSKYAPPIGIYRCRIEGNALFPLYEGRKHLYSLEILRLQIIRDAERKEVKYFMNVVFDVSERNDGSAFCLKFSCIVSINESNILNTSPADRETTRSAESAGDWSFC